MTNDGWTKDLGAKTKYPFFTFFKKTVITREDNLPYLIRRTLISVGKWFSLKLHKIIMSDDACLHDHPWAFLTFIYKGGYYEWTDIKDAPTDRTWCGHKISPDGKMLIKVWYPPGTILYRPARWAHSLELKHDVVKPCYTFVITFKVIRKWGFFTKSGWIYWRNYTKQEHCDGIE